MLCRWCRHDGNGYSCLHSNYRSEYYEYLRHGLRSEPLNNPVLEVWILRFRAGNMYCFLSVRISSLSLCPTAPFRIWILAVWYVHRFLFQNRYWYWTPSVHGLGSNIILGGFSFSGDMSKFLFYSFGYCPFKGGETLMIISIYDKKR